MPVFTPDQLKRQLRQNARSVQTHSGALSRRVRNELDSAGEGEGWGYPSVACYVQRGLGGETDALLQVLGRIVAFQRDSRLSYDLHLFSFGWPEAGFDVRDD